MKGPMGEGLAWKAVAKGKINKATVGVERQIHCLFTVSTYSVPAEIFTKFSKMSDPKLLVMQKNLVKLFKTSFLKKSKEKLLLDLVNGDNKGFRNRVLFYKQQRCKKTHHPSLRNPNRRKDKLFTRILNALCRYANPPLPSIPRSIPSSSRSVNATADPGSTQLPMITTFWRVVLPLALKDQRGQTGLWVRTVNEMTVPKCSRGFKGKSDELPGSRLHQTSRVRRDDVDMDKDKDLEGMIRRLTDQFTGTAEQEFYTEGAAAMKEANRMEQEREPEERELPPPQRCRLSCPLPPLEFIPLEEKDFLSSQRSAAVRSSFLAPEFLPRQDSATGKKAPSVSLKAKEEAHSRKGSPYASAPASADLPKFLPKSIKNKKLYLNLQQLKSRLTPREPEVVPKMKALMFEPDSLLLNYDAVNAPTKIYKDEVLVQVSYSGVCGTDLFITEGKVSCGTSPVILGHEISGRVYATGSDVHHVQPGDDIAVNAYTACCVCRYCSRGFYSACVNDGLHNSIGVSKNGGWAEFVVVKKSQVHKIPPELGLDQAALVQPLSCVLSAFSKLTISHGMDVLIQGLGLSGCLWASILHSKGLRNVFVSERSSKKRAQFESLSLDFPFIPPEDIGKHAMDVVIECTGLPISIEKAFNILNPNGQMCFFGKPNPLTEVRCIPYEIINKEITIVGNAGNAFCFSKALDLAASMGDQYLDFEKLGVRIFDLEDYREAFQLKKLGEVGKIMFKFES